MDFRVEGGRGLESGKEGADLKVEGGEDLRVDERKWTLEWKEGEDLKMEGGRGLLSGRMRERT